MNRKGRRVVVNDETAESDKFAWRKFRKRPIVISAVQMDVPFKVETLEGWMEGRPGDWLIEGIEGELYPCKDSVFRATYEVVARDAIDALGRLLNDPSVTDEVWDRIIEEPYG